MDGSVYINDSKLEESNLLTFITYKNYILNIEVSRISSIYYQLRN